MGTVQAQKWVKNSISAGEWLAFQQETTGLQKDSD